MKINLSKYGQYKNDIFTKLNFNFTPKKKLLDVGCGDGSDSIIFVKEYKLNTYGIDIYKHDNIDKVKGLKFKKAGIYNIPFADSTFDYVFLHDVLHHIDEENQSYDKHRLALNELRRVCKSGGNIIMVEGNRYNPLFYPHMVLMRGHNHWRQSYFIKVVKKCFPNAKFKFFECHLYPFLKIIWRIYEYIMENYVPNKFIAYNVAIIDVRK